VVRRWLAEHPVLVDRIIVVTYTVMSLLLLTLDLFVRPASGEAYPVSEWLRLAMLELVTIPVIAWMLWRRRTYPLIGFVVTLVISIFSPLESLQGFADSVALLYLLYAIAVFGTVKKTWIGFAVAGVCTWLQLLIEDWRGTPFRFDWGMWVGVMMLYLVVLLIAINLGNRKRYIDALVDRADYLERDRDQLARIAVAEERERIAREMHDIVAHSVSVMIALSEGSARSMESSPEKAADAMRRSAETGRTALAEMRRLLGVLKAEHGEAVEFAPQPGVLNIDACIDEFRQTGLNITSTISGTPPGDDGFGLAVYRIVQESLTNALRYAGPGARVEVHIEYGADATRIRVQDYGRVSHAVKTMENVGTGRGLQGLEERTRMFGGTLTAGKHAHGGWVVDATLPMKEHT